LGYISSGVLASILACLIGPFISLNSSLTGRVLLENTGNIGKSYRKHDEIGTPACITVDFQTLEDQTVTVRDRDSMDQKRVNLEEVNAFLSENYSI